MVNRQKTKMKMKKILSMNQQLPASGNAPGTNAFQIIKNVYPIPLRANHKIFSILILFFSYFIQSLVFYPQLTLQQLIQPDLESQFIVRSQSCPIIQSGWITRGHTIHPPIEGLLPQTGIEPTPFRNSASKVAGLQVDATAGTCQILFS